MKTETLQLEPRLWTGVRYDNKREGDKSYQLVSRDEFGVVADIDPGGFASDEDAELMQQRILLCVNNHDELVGALSSICKYVELLTGSATIASTTTICNKCNAVLAKVKP